MKKKFKKVFKPKYKGHSPAGKRYIAAMKKKAGKGTTPFVSIRTKSTVEKLKKSGLSEKEIKVLTGR